MKLSMKNLLLAGLVLSVVVVTSGCQGTVSVGVAYPGAWGYGPYGGAFGGPYGGVYVGGTVPIW